MSLNVEIDVKPQTNKTKKKNGIMMIFYVTVTQGKSSVWSLFLETVYVML